MTLLTIEMAKGYSCPVNSNAAFKAPDDMVAAQERLSAQRKLALNLKLDATFEDHFNVAYKIEIF